MKYEDAALIEFDGNRQNNFTLIRIVFAWLVLYGHSYAIQKVPGINDPLNLIFQGSVWVGAVAVNGFFAISGFLVAASFVKRGLTEYIFSRVLRIFPALIVCVLISVLILGPVMTNLSLREYFSNAQTYKYLVNSLAFVKMQWNLPGVFEKNTLQAINGSLWTLTVEVICYFLLAFIGWLGVLRNRVVANIFMFTLIIFGYYFFSDFPLIGRNEKWARPSLYFLLGVFFYLNRDKVIFDFRLACCALILVFTSFGREWFAYIFPLSFIYLIFYSAYASEYLAIDSTIGDISYGIYIYAWPVQQIVAYSFPNATPYINTVFSSCAVFILAFCSWRYIEKPALSLKQKILSDTGVKPAKVFLAQKVYYLLITTTKKFFIEDIKMRKIIILILSLSAILFISLYFNGDVENGKDSSQPLSAETENVQFKIELLKNTKFLGDDAWRLSGDTKVSINGVIVKSKSSATQVISIIPEEKYLLSIKASCKSGPAKGRLQVNWASAEPKFISGNVQVFDCEQSPKSYSMEVVAPSDAVKATIYATGHTEKALVIHEVSFKK